MGNLDNNGHSVYLMYYHLILVVKYRRKVIDDAISNRGKEIFLYIADNYGITLEEWNHDIDHVHIMFRAQPKTELSKFINAYKSASSRLLKRNIQRSGRNCGKKHSGARASVFSQREKLLSRQSDSILNRRGSADEEYGL